jgi:pyridoxine 4-dehydrogenase
MTEGTGVPGGTITVGQWTVARLGFGAMRLCGPGVWGEPADPSVAPRVLHRALEMGVGLIDTADAYGPEVNERQIACALHPYPPGLLIATKGGLTRPGPGHWVPDCRPERLVTTCEDSLRRLKLDSIGLYQLHSPDPRVPFEDTLGALIRLREQGKVQHIGLSNVSVRQLRLAGEMVEIASVQNRYNMFDRHSDDVLGECERAGIAFLPWRPVLGGEPPSGPKAEALARLAREKGATVMQVAIAWLLARSPVMLPIPGTASLAHLEENMGAARIRLGEEDMRALS